MWIGKSIGVRSLVPLIIIGSGRVSFWRQNTVVKVITCRKYDGVDVVKDRPIGELDGEWVGSSQACDTWQGLESPLEYLFTYSS